MSTHGRALGRDLAVYGLSTAVLQGATIALTPLLTRVLGPTGYGAYELLQVAVGFLAVLLVLGIDTAVLKIFYDAEGIDHQRRVVSTGLAVVAGVTLAGTAVILLFAGPLSRALLGESYGRSALVAAAVALPATVLMNFTRQTLRIERQPRRYLVASVLGAAAQVGIVTVLVLRTRSVPAVFIGLAVGAIVSSAYSIVAARHLYRPSLSAAQGRTLVRFGAPLIFTGVAGWSVMFADRVILTRFVSLEQIGFYGLANKVALVLNLVIYSFGAGWPPFILQLTAKDPVAAHELRAQTLNRFLVGVGLVAVPSAALAPEVVRVLGGPSFLPAARVVPILVLAFLLFATMPVTQIAMLVTDRTRALASPAVAAAALNIAGCFALCPRFGIAGAAWATVLGFGFQAVVYYVRGQRIDRVGYPLGRTIAFFVIVLPFLALGLWAPSLVVGVAAKLAILALFPVALFVARVVDRASVVQLFAVVRGRTWSGLR